MGTVSIIFREDKANKQGLAPVAIKIYDSVTGKRKQEFTGVRIASKHWDASNLRVVKSHPNSTRMNQAILQKFNSAYNTLLELEQKPDRQNPFEEASDDGGQRDFFAHGAILLAELDAVETDYAKANRVRCSLGNLKRFLGYLKQQEIKARKAGEKPKTSWAKRDSLVFADFSLVFAKNFGKFVLNERGLSKRTLSSNMIGIRKVFKHAIEGEVVNEKWFRFRDFTVSGKGSKITFCKENQLQALVDLELEAGSKAEVFRDLYLFTAYGGGFRWADIVQMQWGRIEGNEIYFKSGKSKTDIAFVLPDVALKILEKYRTADSRPTDFIFPVLDPKRMATATMTSKRYHVDYFNDRANKHLKCFEEAIGLDWRLSFHSSRHTFATMAIRNGMPVEVLRIILGHSDIAITMTYVHITGEQVREEMAKFNQRLNEKVNAVGAASSVGRVATPMADFVRRFVEATAAEMGVEVVGIDGLALEMYEAVQQLPKESQRTVPVRVEVRGGGSGFEEALSSRSLFGDGVRFVAVRG